MELYFALTCLVLFAAKSLSGVALFRALDLGRRLSRDRLVLLARGEIGPWQGGVGLGQKVDEA